MPVRRGWAYVVGCYRCQVGTRSGSLAPCYWWAACFGLKEPRRTRLDRIETDIWNIDARLRGVEIEFGKVDQRLATLERLHLPTPNPAND